MKLTAPAFLAIALFADSATAQKPATCDAPMVQQQVKEVLYTQILNNGRGARAQRFADPFTGTDEAFNAGIKAASAKLQSEVVVREIVDQGYHEQIKARLCRATLLVASNEAFAVPTRYFVQRTLEGSIKVATEFQLPGGGGAGSFNSMIALFDHFYGIAFKRASTAASQRASTKSPSPSPTLAQAERNLKAAERSLQQEMARFDAGAAPAGRDWAKTNNAAWRERVRVGCAPESDGLANAGSAAALEHAIETQCTADATLDRARVIREAMGK